LIEYVLESIYNTITLGAPAVHHSRFAHGGLARMKANVVETNKRLCYLQDKLQDVLVLNSDIDDALDHLTQIIESPSTNIEHSVLKLSLQRVVKAVSKLENISSNINNKCNRFEQYVFVKHELNGVLKYRSKKSHPLSPSQHMPDVTSEMSQIVAYTVATSHHRQR
jgi:hypothetical protein